MASCFTQGITTKAASRMEGGGGEGEGVGRLSFI